MNYKIVSAVIAGALVLFIGGMFLIGGKKTTEVSRDLKTGVDTQQASGMDASEVRRLEIERKEKNQSAYTRAISTADSETCAEIENDSELSKDCSNNVLAALAGRKNDRSYCLEISDAELKARCSNEYYLFESRKSGDAALCGNTEGDDEMKYSCQKNAAFAQIESAAFSGTAETACSTLTGSDAEYCRNRVSNDSDIELTDAAIKSLDAAACGKIKLASLKTNCLDTVYVSLAVKNSDAGLCEKVTDGSKKASCTQALSQVSDAKAFQAAIAAGDTKSCAALTNAEMRTKCLDTVVLKSAISTKDGGLCETISTPETKAQCVSAISAISSSAKK